MFVNRSHHHIMSFFDYGTVGTMILIRKHQIITKYSLDRQIHTFLFVTQLDNKEVNHVNEVASP